MRVPWHEMREPWHGKRESWHGKIGFSSGIQNLQDPQAVRDFEITTGRAAGYQYQASPLGLGADSPGGGAERVLLLFLFLISNEVQPSSPGELVGP